ncbi:polysaccharide deacetylase family protein [Intrasporangium oryzae]|uniref:polysaccharide deacetylase family protein n=1 Tax=Intrasporangium oryzae TaxID=412687 RepID=UPI001FDFF86B|nr:polysaccharide deacetylase family protein [Intrasporangium oryzae]
MPDETPTLGRRALLRGGIASAIGLGAAACSPGDETASTPSSSGSPLSTSSAPTGPTASPAPSASSASAPGASAGGAATVPAVLRTPGPDIRRADSAPPAVALTFHGAGEAALTLRALDVLAAHHAHVTVFAVGRWLAANPELGRAIVAGGHDLGNHTWSHRTLPRLSADAARTEIADGARAVAAIAGSSPLLFRPSGTPESTPTIRAAAAASGYARCISYDVDPADYQDPGTTAVVNRTLAGVQAGSIVSLHLGHAGTVAALPRILGGLAARSLAPVTVTSLLA